MIVFFRDRRLLQINPGWSKADAVVHRCPSLFDKRSGVEQGFGGNAADIETDTAKPLFFFDQADCEAKIGRSKCCTVSARAATKNDKIGSHLLYHEIRFLKRMS